MKTILFLDYSKKKNFEKSHLEFENSVAFLGENETPPYDPEISAEKMTHINPISKSQEKQQSPLKNGFHMDPNSLVLT